MPTVIGQTPQGRDILGYEPHEGCRNQCVTCGNWLRGRAEVRGHWAIHNRGHSVFVDREGRAYHQTLEGRHRRDWDVTPPDNRAADTVSGTGEDDTVDVTGACNYERLEDGTHVAEPFCSASEDESLADVRRRAARTVTTIDRPEGTLGLEVSGEDEACGLIFVRVHTATPEAMAAILRGLSSHGFCTGIN